MFKSKLFQYCAIATAVVATSGIALSSATLQSQSQSQTQTQSRNQVQLEKPTQPPTSEKLAELPNSNKASERSNSDMPSGRVLQQLNLSTEQLQKLKAIRDRDQTPMRELAKQSRQANKELRDLLAGTESSDVIRTKHTQVLNLQQELQKQHFETMLAMREILTPQQRSQLNEIMQKNRQNHPKDRMQNRLEKRLDNLRDRTPL